MFDTFTINVHQEQTYQVNIKFVESYYFIMVYDVLYIKLIHLLYSLKILYSYLVIYHYFLYNLTIFNL